MAVTSTQAGEGKTTTISNLAVSYAQEGKRVLLIDADLRHPSVQETFHLTNKMGLSNILAYQCSAEEVIRITDIENLSIVTTGPIPPNPTELLSSGRLHEIIESWKGDYDIILIDTSPIMAVADGIIVASICDGVILVVQAGKVKQEYIQKSKERLEHVKAHIIGVVLNKKKLNKSESNQFNYYSHLD